MKAHLAKNRWGTPPLMNELRQKAKERGLFNLFLPNHFKESPTNLEYSCCAEIMGKVYWAAQTMNCHAPETGNIELLAKYANEEQKEKWLLPLMKGDFSSAYSMTEPEVASSDATNISIRIERQGDDDTPGLHMNFNLMGYDHAQEGHGEYRYDNVRIPASNIILGEGRAFEIAQGRLGPGRIHHCMRLIGQCERANSYALLRATDERKRPRGKLIGEFDSNIERKASMRLELDALRLVVLNAADTMDTHGNKAGRYVIAQSKILVPEGAARIIDECMQMYGGQGLTQHTPLPEMWTYARFVRLADGPDAAHLHQVGRDQLKTAKDVKKRHERYYELAQHLKKEYGLEDDMAADYVWEYLDLSSKAKL
ncbi:hypothetical protein N7488_011502 [Penicillium malachiteum]|nr:hypothetical protein N7488_011502 [Penicillium malachiteum]